MKRIPWLNSIGYSVVELTRAKRRLATSLLLSIIYWLGIGVATWILANGMELRTSSGQIISPIIATVTIVATLYFTTAVPAMPAAAPMEAGPSPEGTQVANPIILPNPKDLALAEQLQNV